MITHYWYLHINNIINIMCERSLVKDIIPHLHLLDFYDKKKGITLCTIKEMKVLKYLYK